MDVLARIWSFECAVQERAAARVERFEHGALIESADIARVYDANFVRLDRDLDVFEAGDVVRLADKLQGELAHRRVVVPDEAAGARLAPGLEQQGFRVDRHVAMPYEGARSARLRSPIVRETSEAELRPLRAAASGAGNEMALYHERIAAAVATRSYAVPADDCPIASYCSLYREDGVAQIEDVATLAPYRGRGLARAVVTAALGEALAAGDELVFILADDGDWPKAWYARLGFVLRGRRYLFTRT